VVGTGEDDVDGTVLDPGVGEQQPQRDPRPLGGADGLDQPGLADRPGRQQGPPVAGAFQGDAQGDGGVRAQIRRGETQGATDAAPDGQLPGRLVATYGMS
jgi:hypothetical protein